MFAFLPLVVAIALIEAPAQATSEPAGAIPFDSRWDFPNYVNWRPANERPADINPPRFSWPATPTILPVEADLPRSVTAFPAWHYVFQLSQDPGFPRGEGTIEKRTALNFENAFPVLADGKWYWRVGYAMPGKPPNPWSAIRTFTILPGTLAIDRTPIDHAVQDLSRLPRPRLAPAGGDWAALRKRIESDPLTAPLMTQLMADAERIITKDWWKKFPENDTGNGSTDKKIRNALSVEFRDIGRDLAIVALAQKFTGDERYRPAYDY